MDCCELYINESNFFRRRIAKGATYVKLAIKNQSKAEIKKRDKSSGKNSFLAFLHPQRGNPTRVSNHTKNLHEDKRKQMDLFGALKLVNIDK